MKELIIACGLDGAIGKDNELLWNLKDDMKHFVNVTKGKNVVMGRKTFESLPHGPLKGRKNYVLSNTHKMSYYDNGTYVEFLTYDKFMKKDMADYVVIGGSQVYELLVANVDKMYMTLVFDVCIEADSFIPMIDFSQWQTTNTEFYPANERNENSFHIIEMIKR